MIDSTLINSYKKHKENIMKTISEINIRINSLLISSSLNKNKTNWKIVNNRIYKLNIRIYIKLRTDNNLFVIQNNW